MKFGLFFELSVPRPWTHESDRRVYELALEQVKVADELGFDQMWTVEHHFLEEYSHSSAPELWLTAVACHTKNIRIGHGVCTLLPAYNHPVRSAERAAWLDIISNGRLEFGTGRSTTWTELGGFGINPDETKAMWSDSVAAICKMWTQEQFSWDSPYLKLPPRNVLPKPYQRPHPPLWVACSSPETTLQAAERGMGMLGVSVGTPKEQEGRIAEYHRRIQNCEPVGEFVNQQANALNFLYIDENRERGRAMGERFIAQFNRLATQTVGINQVYPGSAYNTPGLLFALRRDSMASGKALIRDGFSIGDPDDAISALKLWEQTGVDGIMFLVNNSQIIPQEDVLNSLRLFAKYVMPAFRHGDNLEARARAVASSNGGSSEAEESKAPEAREPAIASARGK